MWEWGTELGLYLLAIMGLVAFIAGVVDSIAGGGGLIVVPALLLTGLDPLMVLGTNKLQSSFGSFSATLAFARKGHLDVKKWAGLAFISGLGSLFGAFLLTYFSTKWLLTLMPILLLIISGYFAFGRSISNLPAKARMSVFAFGATIVPLIGCYDGFFGPGAGAFFMLAIVTLRGLSAVPATGLTKYLNFGSNIGALIFFILSGKILWVLGLVMGICQFAGAQLGALLAMRIGAGLIKPLLVFISVAMALRLLLSAGHPFRVALSSFFGF
jgi:uncharacterized protein